MEIATIDFNYLQIHKEFTKLLNLNYGGIECCELYFHCRPC
jgi:hypothetical protein